MPMEKSLLERVDLLTVFCERIHFFEDQSGFSSFFGRFLCEFICWSNIWYVSMEIFKVFVESLGRFWLFEVFLGTEFSHCSLGFL